MKTKTKRKAVMRVQAGFKGDKMLPSLASFIRPDSQGGNERCLLVRATCRRPGAEPNATKTSGENDKYRET